jgi:hypothetical protein
MVNTALVAGLKPYQELLRANWYEVASTATAIFIGDPVILSGTGNAVTLATAGTGNPLVGAVIGLYDTNGLPIAYNPATTVAKALIADHPQQRFVVQGDGGGTWGINGSGGNANLVVSAAGSTVSGRSGWKGNEANVPGTTAADQIKILKPVAVVNSDATATGAQYIVMINNHQLLQGIVGVGV